MDDPSPHAPLVFVVREMQRKPVSGGLPKKRIFPAQAEASPVARSLEHQQHSGRDRRLRRIGSRERRLRRAPGTIRILARIVPSATGRSLLGAPAPFNFQDPRTDRPLCYTCNSRRPNTRVRLSGSSHGSSPLLQWDQPDFIAEFLLSGSSPGSSPLLLQQQSQPEQVQRLSGSSPGSSPLLHKA
jgi:hypothetical protein